MKNPIPKILPIGDHLRKHPLAAIFLFGAVLRITVFIFQGPYNNDPHVEVVRYIYQHHTVPATAMLRQADHPPLYYVLAAPFLAGGVKTAQLFSLLLSIGTIWVIFRLIDQMEFIRSFRIKKHCLIFACLMPQFVMWGNYIANETLAILIGALLFHRIYVYLHDPRPRHRNILALLLGLGLLTKATFLTFIPVLTSLVVITNLWKKSPARRTINALFTFTLIFLVLGSYKWVDNKLRYGQFFVFNMKAEDPCLRHQRPTYRGPRSFYDINLLKLLKYPTLAGQTRYSYPLMAYGTFWYQYLPESNFKGNTTPFKYLGSLIYIVAVVPTFLMGTGFFRILHESKDLIRRPPTRGPPDPDSFFRFVSVLLFLSNSLVIFYMAFKYDVWSAIQARYLFPSFVAVILCLYSGLACITRRWAVAEKIIYPWLGILYSCFLLYFCIEIGLRLLVPSA